MIRTLAIHIICCAPLLAHSQLEVVPAAVAQDQLWWEDGWGSKDPFFTSFRKYRGEDLPFDSLFSIYQSDSNARFIKVNALIDQTAGMSLRENDLPYNAGLGAVIHLEWKHKWAISAFGLANFSNQPSWIRPLQQQFSIVPGHALQRPTNVFSPAWGGSLAWRPSKYFLLEGGRDRVFIGDGHRSLLLSDYAPEYYYGMITTTFWRIRYVNLYSIMQDRYPDPFLKAYGYPKYANTHYVALNLKNRFELGLFESIVWQGRDTMVNRGYDINYLNPIIFFRPVEYSLGSADNALLGMNLRYTPAKGLTLYAQILFDEFYLKEIRADILHALKPNDTTIVHGWWANKYGFQFGVKARDPFRVEGLRAAAEINLVRPYTYAHGTVPQNYGHQNHALAHPLGANFKELIAKLQYDLKGFTFSSQLVVYTHGTDSTGDISYGGNVFQSYNSQYRPFEYGHQIGQGFGNAVTLHQLSISRVLLPRYGLTASASWIYRRNNAADGDRVANYFFVSLQTPMRRRLFDL